MSLASLEESLQMTVVNENLEIDKSDVFGGLQLRVQQNKEK